MNDKLLKEILVELKNIHSHLENLETLYKFTNRVEIKEKEIAEDKR